MKFEQRGRPNPLDGSASADAASTPCANVLAFRKTGNVDLKFDDGVMERVKGIWEKILGDDADAEREGFMKFEERETMGDDEDEE